jgi:type IV secretion system protein VirB3
MQHEEINSHPVYVAMTRPPMFFGVTLSYLAIAIGLTLIIFMPTHSLKFALVYIPLHIFGWIGCKFDVNFFNVLSKKMICSSVANKNIWGCQSYEPF